MGKKIKSVSINGRKYDIENPPEIISDSRPEEPSDVCTKALKNGLMPRDGDRVRILHHDELTKHGIVEGLTGVIHSPIWRDGKVIYKVVMDDMDASFWFDFDENTPDAWTYIVEVVHG